jgi:hypothetical protein
MRTDLTEPSYLTAINPVIRGKLMDIQLEWQNELLQTNDFGSQNYTLNLESIPAKPGIYIFGRRFGGRLEALYVGKAEQLRSRVNTQLNNHRLMTHVLNAKSGQRIVLVGTFWPKKGQQRKICLAIAERALIRYFLGG